MEAAASGDDGRSKVHIQYLATCRLSAQDCMALYGAAARRVHGCGGFGGSGEGGSDLGVSE
jgi:hypothetical protein